jgi:hypothetical protein
MALSSGPWVGLCDARLAGWFASRDRKSISDKDDPFQLVASGEKRVARWGSAGDGPEHPTSD